MVRLNRVCQLAWRFGRVSKDWQIDRPHAQKGKQEWMNQLRRHLSACSLRKSVCQDAAKITESKVDGTQCGFRHSNIYTLKVLELCWQKMLIHRSTLFFLTQNLSCPFELNCRVGTLEYSSEFRVARLVD